MLFRPKTKRFGRFFFSDVGRFRSVRVSKGWMWGVSCRARTMYGSHIYMQRGFDRCTFIRSRRYRRWGQGKSIESVSDFGRFLATENLTKIVGFGRQNNGSTFLHIIIQ